jgi:hypothetical protein
MVKGQEGYHYSHRGAQTIGHRVRIQDRRLHFLLGRGDTVLVSLFTFPTFRLGRFVRLIHVLSIPNPEGNLEPEAREMKRKVDLLPTSPPPSQEFPNKRSD